MARASPTAVWDGTIHSRYWTCFRPQSRPGEAARHAQRAALPPPIGGGQIPAAERRCCGIACGGPRKGCVISARDQHRDIAEQPVLWLGISGFTPGQRASLEAALPRAAALPRWRLCALGDADAWWVNGAKVRLMPDGNLKVAAGLPTEHALQLNLSEVDRPVAFASPLASPQFEPRCVFDPESE